MSLLEKIKAKKDNLTPTETRVTSPAGNVTIESKYKVIKQEIGNPGYIIDLKPDLQVANVLQNLYMGSQDPAADEDLLNKFNIKHVVSLGLAVPHFKGISYYRLPILDLPEFNIISYLKDIFNIIDAARNCDESVYVHCNAGISRASTVVIAYVMKVNSWSYSKAYEYVKGIRPCIRPNNGFVKQLISIENRL